MTPVVLDTPEQVVTQYRRMIHRQVQRCLDKLPDSTTLNREDLYQEGVARLLHAFAVYQRTNAAVTTAARPRAAVAQGPVRANGTRQACFTSYAQAALMNGYAKLVKKEWRAWGPMDRTVAVLDEPDHEALGAQVCPAVVGEQEMRLLAEDVLGRRRTIIGRHFMNALEAVA
jgi:hypothetical protein